MISVITMHRYGHAVQSTHWLVIREDYQSCVTKPRWTSVFHNYPPVVIALTGSSPIAVFIIACMRLHRGSSSSVQNPFVTFFRNLVYFLAMREFYLVTEFRLFTF